MHFRPRIQSRDDRVRSTDRHQDKLMRKLLAAAFVATAIASPVLAQDMPTFTDEEVATATAAIEGLGLTAETYQELWCGAAFLAFSRYLEEQGNAEGAAEATTMSHGLFARVETTLAPQNLTQEQLQGIGRDASIVALTQLGTGENVEFTQEECTATAQAQ
jgi:hypothetical protein